MAKGHRADNPGETVKALLAKHQKVEAKGHRSLAYGEVAGALATVWRSETTKRATKLALEFLVLTAARSGEVRFATWSEIDTDAATWTVPAERMKAGREHRVPLSTRALEILGEASEFHTVRTDLIFPGRGGKQMAESAFVHALDRLGIDTTAHGFRSSFRVWGAERTNIPREVCEAALAPHHHQQGRSGLSAFSDLFDRRRDLMERWAAYLSEKPADVVSITTGRAVS